MTEDDYSDILDLPRPQIPGHKPMSARDRAAQFQSFAALSGFEKALEKARETYEREQREKEKNLPFEEIP